VGAPKMLPVLHTWVCLPHFHFASYAPASYSTALADIA